MGRGIDKNRLWIRWSDSDGGDTCDACDASALTAQDRIALASKPPVQPNQREARNEVDCRVFQAVAQVAGGDTQGNTSTGSVVKAHLKSLPLPSVHLTTSVYRPALV